MSNANLISMLHTNTDNSVVMRIAVITGQADHWYFLEGIDLKRALLATSCLIQPEVGDTVLVCDSGSEMNSYILLTLSKLQSDCATIRLPGGSQMQCTQDAVKISSPTLSMQAGKSLSLHAPEVELKSLIAKLSIKHFHGILESANLNMLRLDFVAKVVQSFAERFIQKSNESYRSIKGIDQTQAGHVNLTIDGKYNMHSKHTNIDSEGMVRINGEKINLG
jgi:hypothetical protein